MLDRLLRDDENQRKLLMTIQDDYINLKAKVSANSSALQSAEQVMDQLKASVDALNAQIASGQPVTSEQLQALSDQLTNDDNGLAASIVKNTPVEPPSDTPAPAPAPAPTASTDPGAPAAAE
ncbi:MAG TPA: hypothetical protein VMT89_01920 [Candidatus Acidoferrales bacterium]|nr:hypothetical protein [Candidatus Acidoferrales bacterium]